MTTEPAPDADRRIELRIREGVQPGAQDPIEDIRNELEDLALSGRVDDVETVVWGRRLPLDPAQDDAASMVDTFQRFRAWAKRNGADLEPAFRVHDVTSLGVDESYLVVTVPMVCLAAFRGEDVVGVYPHSVDGEVVTVQQGLERILQEAHDEARVPNHDAGISDLDDAEASDLDPLIPGR